MADEFVIVKPVKYTFEGLIDVKGLFNFIKDMLEDNGYGIKEKEYNESTGSAKEISAKMFAEKPINDYFMARIDYFLDISASPVESSELYKGKVTLVVRGVLVADFMGKVSKSPFGKFLSNIYTKFIGIDETKEVEGIVKGDVKELLSRVKQYMRSLS